MLMCRNQRVSCILNYLLKLHWFEMYSPTGIYTINWVKNSLQSVSVIKPSLFKSGFLLLVAYRMLMLTDLYKMNIFFKFAENSIIIQKNKLWRKLLFLWLQLSWFSQPTVFHRTKYTKQLRGPKQDKSRKRMPKPQLNRKSQNPRKWLKSRSQTGRLRETPIRR